MASTRTTRTLVLALRLSVAVGAAWLALRGMETDRPVVWGLWFAVFMMAGSLFPTPRFRRRRARTAAPPPGGVRVELHSFGSRPRDTALMLYAELRFEDPAMDLPERTELAVVLRPAVARSHAESVVTKVHAAGGRASLVAAADASRPQRLFPPDEPDR